MSDHLTFARHEFNLPEFWLYFLTYGEDDTLEEEETAQILAFLADHGFDGRAVFSSDEDNGFCRVHDASPYGVGFCSCRAVVVHMPE